MFEEKKLTNFMGGAYPWFCMERITKQLAIDMNRPTKEEEAVNLDEKISPSKRILGTTE